MQFWNELKRRHVFKVAAAYAVVAWLAVQIASIVLPTFDSPAWVMQALILLTALGFPVALVLAWAFELTPDGVRSQENVDITDDPDRRTAVHLNRLIISGLVLALAIVVLDAYVLNDDVVRSREAARIETLANSVAVLPFENLSSDPDQDYFADGVSLELREGLNSASELSVAPRELVLAFRNSTESPTAIATSLNVAHVLTGSLRKAGNNVRITATLVRAADALELWSEPYEGTLADIFDIQSDIAASVIEALTGTFDPELIELFPGGTSNEEAYDLYLRAVAETVPFFSPLGEGRDALYSQALELDPEFAQAQIALASYLVIRSDFAYGFPEWEEFSDAANRAVQRAIELAPELPGTLVLEARRQVDTLQWAAAERTYQKAMEVTEGRDYEVNNWYGNFLLNVGRLDEAVVYLERSRRLAPFLARPVSILALAYDALGDDTRVAELQDGFSNLIGGDNIVLNSPEIFRQIYLGNVDVAMRMLESGGIADVPLFRQLDDRAATIESLYAANESPEGAASSTQSFIAMLAAIYGDPDLAVSAWRRTLRGSFGYLMFTWTPYMTPVRTHSDFKGIAQESRLVEYWRQVQWPDQCEPVGSEDFKCL